MHKQSDIGISKIDNRYLLRVGKECVEIADFKIISSAQSGAELVVTIRSQNEIMEFESSATRE